MPLRLTRILTFTISFSLTLIALPETRTCSGQILNNPEPPPETPHIRKVGVIINSRTYTDVETQWRGNPGGKEAFSFIHNGYGGSLERTRKLLETSFRKTGGRVKILVRPCIIPPYKYATEILKSKHANLILGWYIVDEPFAFTWGLDQIPRQNQTKCEYWLDYKAHHNGTPPWPAEVDPMKKSIAELTEQERKSIWLRGGDDIYFTFEMRDALRKAESELSGSKDCRNTIVRNGGHLPIYADYGGLCPSYGWSDGRMIIAKDMKDRLGFWWYDAEKKMAVWKRSGSVSYKGEIVERKYNAFGEDIVIDNWFASPYDAKGRPRPRTYNRIDGALEMIKAQIGQRTQLYFFLGYGQDAAHTKRNIELAEAEGGVAGYVIWSWDMSNPIKDNWLGMDANKNWAALMEWIP